MNPRTFEPHPSPLLGLLGGLVGTLLATALLRVAPVFGLPLVDAPGFIGGLVAKDAHVAFIVGTLVFFATGTFAIPFVIARVGPGRAREFFITGERFLAPVALSIGLVQHVAAHELALDGLIDSKISQILTSAPNAIAAAKELIFGVAARTLESSLEFAADAIARARTGEEGQAGMQAFLERQKPPWIEKNEKNEKNERIDTK